MHSPKYGMVWYHLIEYAFVHITIVASFFTYLHVMVFVEQFVSNRILVKWLKPFLIIAPG